MTSNRASFLDKFQSEIERLEFSPDAEQVILPVPRHAALAWVNGEIGDFDLVARAGKPEIVWCYLLPRQQTTRETFLACANLIKQGASGFIAHSRTPLVQKHLLKHGCAPRFRLADGGIRFWGDSTFVQRYFRVALSSVPA